MALQTSLSLRSLGRATKRKLLGLLMLAVLAALFLFTVLVYQKALPWQSRVDVTLLADRIGHQLIVPADVKLRGVIVGQVREVSSTGEHAVMKLALDPGRVAQIPDNVQARILPKTLFGEKFVDLVVPAGQPAARHIRAGDVIPEDHSKTALELQNVFNDLVPVLKALKPAQLSLALSSLADALRGRGEALGENFVKVDRYFSGLNPHIPTIQHDISGLADLAQNYADAAPDLLRMARNFAVNAQTLTQKQDAFTSLLEGTKAFADTWTTFLQKNQDNLIALAKVSQPTLALLARYSPEFPCLLQGLVRINPLLDSTFAPEPGSGPALHIDLQMLPQQPNGYTWPTDKPAYDQHNGPDCRGLPGVPSASVPVSPGAALPMSGAGIGMPGSEAERAVVSLFAAPMMGVPSSKVPDLADLLAGPMLRGMAVSMR